MSFTLPPETRIASLLGGVLTAVYPGRPYKRKVNEVIVTCSVASPVVIYRDIIADPGKIATNSIGASNTFNPVNRVVIPAGAQVYVVWPSASSGSANAVITFEGDPDD